MPTHKCEICDKEFHVKPSRAKIGWGRFCSLACRGIWQSAELVGENSPNWEGGPVNRECLVCGISFKADRGEVNKGWANFCSQKCRGIASRKKKKEYVCKNCGQTFKDEKWRNFELKFCTQKCMGEWYSKTYVGPNSSNWQGGKTDHECEWCGETFKDHERRQRRFCCPECSWEWSSKYKRGEKHHAWLGGISFEPYGEEFDDELREKVRQRDRHICQICGDPQDHPVLAVHHIDYNKQNNHPTNLIALCKPCHSTTNGHRDYWERRLKGHIAVIYDCEQLSLRLVA